MGSGSWEAFLKTVTGRPQVFLETLFAVSGNGSWCFWERSAANAGVSGW